MRMSIGSRRAEKVEVRVRRRWITAVVLWEVEWRRPARRTISVSEKGRWRLRDEGG
jgi:hypothetical protein